MSQNSLMHTGGQFSKTPGLKPPLAAALASLEVQLDRELARYRRTRTGGYRASNSNALGTSNGASNSSVGLQFLTPVTTTTEDVAYPSLEENNNENHENNEISSETRTDTRLTNADELITTLPPPPPPPQSPVKVISDSVKEPATTTPLPPPKPASASSIVPVTTVKTEPSQNISQNMTSDSPKTQPDDYLESSEALLRSLTEEAPKAQKRPNNNNSLLSPLGIGSILLFVMSGLILGYAVINPKGMPQLGLGGLFKSDSSTASNSDSSSQVNNGNTKTVAQPQLTPIPKYPNLATDEFPEVNSPNDVVGLKPKPKATPSGAPVPTAPVQNQQSGINNAVPSIPSINPTVPAKEAPVAITPSSAPTQEVSISDLKPSADGFYHVVIDNNSKDTFASARKAVPDAYLSPDGKLIYLGAIKNKEKAQELLTEIKRKGLNARFK